MHPLLGLRALIVAPHSRSLESTTEALVSFGVDVVTARTLRRTKELLATGLRHDVLLLDAPCGPRSEAAAFLQEHRALMRRGSAPVFLLVDQDHASTSSVSSEIDGIVPAPLGGARLVAALHEWRGEAEADLPRPLAAPDAHVSGH